MPGDQDDQQVTDDHSTDLSTESGDQPLEGARDDSEPPTDNTSSADGLPADIDWQSSDAAPEQASKTGDCSGWERDPQSFAKALAGYYLRNELGAQPALVKTSGALRRLESRTMGGSHYLRRCR